jgi:hypothetical protein
MDHVAAKGWPPCRVWSYVVEIVARIWCTELSSPLLQFRPISARITYFGGNSDATLSTRTGPANSPC